LLQTIKLNSYGHAIRFSKNGDYIAARDSSYVYLFKRSGDLYDDESKMITIDAGSGGSLWDRSFLFLDNDWMLFATDSGDYTLLTNLVTRQRFSNVVLNISNNAVTESFNGYYQVESCEVTKKYSVVAGLVYPSKLHIVAQIIDVTNIGNTNANAEKYIVTFDEETLTRLKKQGKTLECINFGGRENLWLIAGDQNGDMHFWEIDIVNKQAIDVTDQNHKAPKLQFRYIPISQKNKRHFRPLLAVAGCVGSDVVVSGARDGNLVLWSLHYSKPAPSLFMENKQGREGYCNEIWSADIRPGQAIFATWNRIVGMVHIVDRALDKLREDSAHEHKNSKKKKEENNNDEKSNEDTDASIRKTLDALGVNDNTIAVQSEQQWTTIQAWYKVWIQGDSILYGVRSMVKGVMEHLALDKKKIL